MAGNPVCACDGRTYASVCEASEAGVNVPSFQSAGACGSTLPMGAVICGRDADCPDGQTCCARYGVCVAASCTTCCAPPPPGTELPCESDRDCRALVDPHGMLNHFCFGAGCGDDPGGCVRAEGLTCTGELAPVCGCDGRTYTNACSAAKAATRTAHDGPC